MGPGNGTSNVKTQTGYDGLGEMLSSTDADGKTTGYSYDGADRLAG